jgi:trimeric autotransporter adhesin
VVVAKLRTELRIRPHLFLVLAMLTCTARMGIAQTLSPTTAPFGNWVVQTTSTAKSIVLLNTQTVPLTITGISTSGDFVQTSNCPISPNTLTAKLSCTISITFTPTALGARTGTLTVNDSAANSPQTVKLTGTGVTPASLSATTLGFNSQPLNSTSTAQALTLQNYQTVPLTITGISTSGDFAQTSTCPLSPSTLASGTSCTISITFSPTALGSRTGILTVSDSAPNSPQTAQLSGTGVTPAGLSASSLGFGSEFVNTITAAKVLTLQNNETVPLTITGLSTSGDFAQTSNCPLSPNTLAAKLSCTISVSFTPTALGARTGTLTVTDSAPNSPQTAQLTGTGTAPVSTSPTALTFASQLFGSTSAAKSVTVTNNQTVPISISGITTSGDFAQTSTCPSAPNTLGAGATCAISVTFTPTAVGTRTGILTITDNASVSQQTVSLSGTGSLSGLLSISVAPANSTLTPGTQQQFVATGVWKGGVQLNITNLVTWSSSAPGISSVSSTGLVQAIAPGATTIVAAYGSVSGTTAVTVSAPTVTSISVVPNAPSVPVGAYQQFTAEVSYSDGSMKNATSSVSWSTSAANVATVNSSGLASALAAGSATITATAESVTGGATLSVSQPACVSAPPGLIGWWTGDDNTVDISGNNSGTLQNGATYGNGEVGQAFNFAGNGASVLVNSPVYSPTAGTVMFWFFPTGAGTLTGSFGGTNRTPGLFVDASGNVTWEFGNLSAQALGQVSFNQWSQAALTYSTSNSQVAVNVYLNGTLAATASSSQNSSWYPQLAFGAYLGAQKPSFAGSMDEVAIFNQALNAQQIQQVYDAFSAGMCKPTLQSIALTPANPSIAAGLSQQFDAVGSYSDGTTHDMTTSANWSSTNPPVATVNGSGKAVAVATGSATINAALGAETGSTNLTVVPSLVSVQVNPPNPSIADGTTQPFAATGTFSDGSTQNITTSVTWSSSLVSIATVTASGLANGIAAGQTTIAATAGSISGSTVLTVTPATLTAITVTPANPTISVGTSQSFTATGLFSDGSTEVLTTSVNWSSSTPALATVNSSGLATGLVAGQTTITATSGSVSGSAALNVTSAVLTSIAVNPVNPSILVGSTQQFSATGTYSDGSTQDLTSTATWNSSNINVASLSSTALATGLSVGATTISATVLSIVGSTTPIVTGSSPVLQSISVTPATSSAAIGQNQQFGAAGLYSDGSTQNLTNSVSWSSSQPTIATIANTGLASGVSGGSTSITATLGSISASATLSVNSLALVSITVTPGNPSLALGTNQQFKATGTYADGSTLDLTTSVIWNSSMPSVATVNVIGLVTTAFTGQTTITAADVGITGTSTLMVTPASLVSIAITPTASTISQGTTQQFAATGTFSDGSTQNITGSVQWASSNGYIVTISNASGSQGLATSAAQGVTNISATQGSISTSTTLTVSAAALVSIAVSPPSPSIALGTTQSFAATGTFTDGSTQDLTSTATWASGNPAVATVSSNALGTSVSTGAATITATLGSISGSTLLTVTPASVVSITVNPSVIAIPLGLNQAFSAVGIFTDGSTQNLTPSAHWSSTVPAVATVSNTAGSNGLATSTGSGSTIISATSGAVTGSANLTVTAIVLAAIEVSPLSPSISIGTTQQFTATGLYTDGSTTNITSLVAWASSSASVATIGNSSGSQGLATGTTAGTTTISATYGALTGSTSLTVQDSLVSISIAPPSATMVTGASQQFTATATYASGLTNDVTDSALWSSSTPSVATISSTGLATSEAAGQTVISASIGSISGSNTLAVTATPVPTNFRVDISVGTTGQLFVSWDSMSGATYYNLQRSTNPNSGYSKVVACSGKTNLKITNTTTVMEACRDGGLTVGTSYYYEVQACYSAGCSSFSAAASNAPVTSNCTTAEIPSTVGITTLPAVTIESSTVDPEIQFLPNNNQYAYYPSPAVPHRNLLLVDLPGSDETCPGSGAFNDTAERLGFDVICVNYSNLAEQTVICIGNPTCFGNISQAKLNATGVCSTPGQSQCGIDPKTGQPYYLSNQADAVTQRISMMLQYLNNHGYNANGTNWGNYLSGTTPLWQDILLVGHSQGGVMSTYTAYENVVARAINLSAPPQATLVNKVEVGATYLTNTPATTVRNIYGLVSVYDPLYQQGVYSAVWQLLGFIPANNDAEVTLNTSTPIGLNCNSGTPSHNFSTSAPPGPAGGHVAPLYLWNEDIYKFMLID